MNTTAAVPGYLRAALFPAGNRLAMDILNPHHTKYYQEGHAPADCENPVPNFFLTVPEGSEFTFHVQCETSRLPDTLQSRWQELVKAALGHAFNWLGFGAKTAVGYGVFVPVAETGDVREAVVEKCGWIERTGGMRLKAKRQKRPEESTKRVLLGRHDWILYEAHIVYNAKPWSMV